jgi:peptidoglycan-N-acetylglucosamine deacetylase
VSAGTARRWPIPASISASVGLHLAAGASAMALPGAWPWALGAVAVNHLGLTAAGLWPRSHLLGPNLTRLPAAACARGEVAITVDDGPDPEVTPAVLDLLAATTVGGQPAQATFFCIGQQVRQHPALVRRIVAAGHSVQNHSQHHRHQFSLLGTKGLTREIADTQALLADVTGQLPHCFRAPAGLRNPLLDPVLHRLNLHLVSWTRRGFDTRVAAPQQVLASLTKGLAAGDIVLLHDGHARRTAQGQPVLLQVLPALLQAVHAAGLRTTTLSAAVPARYAVGAAVSARHLGVS